MSWFKRAGRWLGKSDVEEEVSVETIVQYLLASLLIMTWFMEVTADGRFAA